ncbi:hypothetical protein [Agromyces sp. GXQ0307]|uniref:hypothetical protein n=1 Tax=Agromyces sp. GXQ0307 TaxID=3377835 RepID=UPI003839F162
MDPDSIFTLISGLGGAGVGAVIRWRALWIARRLYRVPGWRGQSVDEVASTIRVSSLVLITMGLIYAALGALGIEAPSLR